MSIGNDRALKIATGVAIIVVIVGGSLYIGGLRSPSRPVEVTPIRTDKQNPTATTRDSVGAAGSETPVDLGVARPMMPEALSLTTRPRILPQDEYGSVRAEMDRVLVPWQACYEEAAGSPPELHGKAFVHFTIDESGEPADVKVRLKGIAGASIVGCMRQATERLVFGETAEGTSVYWPVRLDRKRGVVLTEPAD